MNAIEVMIRLKSPEKIYLMSHNYCGAAEAIGVSDDQMKRAHAEYGELLKKRFPHIPVIVLHECHSECGEHHDGHEVLLQEAA